jgi:hypothetical protein
MNIEPLRREEIFTLTELLVAILAIVGTLYFRAKEKVFWASVLAFVGIGVLIYLLVAGHWVLAVGIVFIALALLTIIWLIKKYRRFKLVHDFNGYCIECERMLNKSGDHGDVMTIQTPIEKIPEDATASFNRYLQKTFEVIIATERGYQRLVLLEKNNTISETRIKEFINNLIDYAADWEASNPTVPFDLRNIQIGLVLSEKVKDLIYSNVDIHCTTNRDFSIAFMAREAQKGISFGSSLHLHEHDSKKKKLATLIRRGLGAVWDQAKHITIGDFYPKFSGNEKSRKSGENISAIKTQLSTKVDEIVAELKT